MIPGASDLCAIGGEQAHGLDVRGKDAVMDARPVGSCGHHAGEGLLRDGSEIDHGEAMCFEYGMQVLESDAALGVYESLFGIDLWRKDRVRLEKKNTPCLEIDLVGWGKTPGFQRDNERKTGYGERAKTR